MRLYNLKSGDLLRKELQSTNENRLTASFYKYHPIPNPFFLRDHLYLNLNEWKVLGRIYIAGEGINAQISFPEHRRKDLVEFLHSITFLENTALNYAIEDNGKSFLKLKVKVRDKIVADGLNDRLFDVMDSGVHLDAERFNELSEKEDTLVIDMRNHYESEVGRFVNSMTTGADTFREALRISEKMLEPYRDKNIIMYCTGGIRCEKASAYFKYLGYKNIYQLKGGILQYTRDAKSRGLPNKFVGKNFVFDDRLGERISDHIVAHCHQCGEPCDSHTNCRNKSCNLLFIQCKKCADQFGNCCSDECREITLLPENKQKMIRKGKDEGIRIFTKGRFHPPPQHKMNTSSNPFIG